ncbi:unnamed protein product [Orchesella dallaii]|uniref:Uncharacterized protein n=1 Tax=Orchesella dallaii TaxID=48710 RepID=A0ABP1RZT4_9HEXA
MLHSQKEYLANCDAMAAESTNLNISSDQEDMNVEVEQVSDCEAELIVVLDSDTEENCNSESEGINYSKLKEEAISVMTRRGRFQGLRGLTDSSELLVNPEQSDSKPLTKEDCEGGTARAPFVPETPRGEVESFQASKEEGQAVMNSSDTVEVEVHLKDEMKENKDNTQQKVLTKAFRGRREYSREDGQRLLDAVCDFGAFRDIKGDKFWKEMENLLVVGHHRTFHSLKNHFLRTVLPSVLKKKKVYVTSSTNLKNLKDGLFAISRSNRFPGPSYLVKLNANPELKKYDKRML